MSDTDPKITPPGRLSAANRLKTWSTLADIASKTIIAVAALAVTAAAGCISHIDQKTALAEQQRANAETAKANSEKAAADAQTQQIAEQGVADNKMKMRQDTANLLLSHVPASDRDRLGLLWAIAYCKSPTEFGVSDGANGRLCSAVADLGAQEQSRTAPAATQAATSAVKSDNPKSYLNSPAAASQNLGVAAAESAQPASGSAAWYAVVGTLPQSAPEAVRGLAIQLNARLLGAGLPPNDVHVYKTQISKSFALTSGQDKSEADARARVRMLRKAGFSDAFAQVDRGWTKADQFR